MKIRIIIFFVLGINLFSCIQINSQQYYFGEFEERTNPYFWGSKDSIIARDLTPNVIYGVLIGSNQASSEQQWINFTADSTKAKIVFRQNSAEYTNETVKLTQLFIDLYYMTSINGENLQYLDRLTLNIIYKNEQVDFSNIINQIILLIIYYMFLLAIGGFTYAMVTTYKKYRN